MVKKQKSARIKRPLGVKILSVLGYIGAVSTLIMGLIALIAAPFFFTLMPTVTEWPWLAAAGTALSVSFGIFFIFAAILDYFIARGLWRGQNWARIVILVFVWLGAISALLSFNAGGIVINALVIWYLQFKKESKAYFK